MPKYPDMKCPALSAPANSVSSPKYPSFAMCPVDVPQSQAPTPYAATATIVAPVSHIDFFRARCLQMQRQDSCSGVASGRLIHASRYAHPSEGRRRAVAGQPPNASHAAT